MKKVEHVYTTLAAHAKDLCGITLDEYHHSRTETAVDARMLVVGWMIGYGYTEATISRLTGWSQQRINYLRNAAADRMARRIWREMYHEITRRMVALVEG